MGVPAGEGRARRPGRAPALRAPAPGWCVTADVVVVGSGVAGLTVALRCAAAVFFRRPAMNAVVAANRFAP